ncbi:hypothetical protein P4T48_27005 [Bacillus paramycoides]|uniref:hypothetical protein n=1 Tax=Bacillus paramycoides TaxID=2026194 RepID=UPI002E1D3604|nr:hypothetical protein [Bacillus paramycoides]
MNFVSKELLEKHFVSKELLEKHFVSKELLEKHNVINGIFDYRNFDIDEEMLQIYSYFESSFVSLYATCASAFNLKDCCFYIKDNNTCNAFASNPKGYNIIGITNAYPILLSKKLDKKYFKSITLAGINNDKPLEEAYIDLYEDKEFDIGKFMIDCSIEFTFRHEFQHIMQLNSSKFGENDFLLQENPEKDNFDIRKHAWEFDADRMASYEVLKHVFRVHSNLKVKSDEKLKCLLYLGCSSMIITKCLFYFRVMNQLESHLSVRKEEFYTKEGSHPHPLVRCMNIMEYYFDNITDDFPRLEVNSQELLNNTLAVTKLYFDSLIPTHDTMSDLFGDLGKHLDTINNYNQELYEAAIQDEAIRNLLQSRKIQFEDIQSFDVDDLSK